MIFQRCENTPSFFVISRNVGQREGSSCSTTAKLFLKQRRKSRKGQVFLAICCWFRMPIVCVGFTVMYLPHGFLDVRTISGTLSNSKCKRFTGLQIPQNGLSFSLQSRRGNPNSRRRIGDGLEEWAHRNLRWNPGRGKRRPSYRGPSVRKRQVKQFVKSISTWRPGDLPPITFQRTLVYINISFFLCQIASAVSYVPTMNLYLDKSGYDALSRFEVATQTFFGNAPTVLGSGRDIVATSLGPFTVDYYHMPSVTSYQPHRLLTAGFLHSGIIHLVLNMRYLWMMPTWVEFGLGKFLYFSTYVAAIIGGNIAHSECNKSFACLGASGGICGLNGLMCSMLWKMGRKDRAKSIAMSLLYLILYGLYNPRISNAGHVGGFLVGLTMGILFGPGFRRSYVAKKGGWRFIDDSHPQLRSVMGPLTVETPSKISLTLAWLVLLAILFENSTFRRIPRTIVYGIIKPGCLGGLASASFPK